MICIIYTNAYVYVPKIHKYMHMYTQSYFWTGLKLSLFLLRTWTFSWTFSYHNIIIPSEILAVIQYYHLTQRPHLESPNYSKKVFKNIFSMQDPTKGHELHLVFM